MKYIKSTELQVRDLVYTEEEGIWVRVTEIAVGPALVAVRGSDGSVNQYSTLTSVLIEDRPVPVPPKPELRWTISYTCNLGLVSASLRVNDAVVRCGRWSSSNEQALSHLLDLVVRDDFR